MAYLNYYYYSDYLTNYLLLWSITSLLTSPSIAPYILSRKECLTTLTKMVEVGVLYRSVHRSFFTNTNWNVKGLNVYSSSRLGSASIYEPCHRFFPGQSPTCHQDVTVTWTSPFYFLYLNYYLIHLYLRK
jgi:hypothetical protein